jgi:hypothetical protein
MYLDITIPWCKFKKKINDGKSIGNPRSTTLTEVLIWPNIDELIQ